MSRWTIDTPTALEFDGVVTLRVRMVGGSVAVLAADGRPRLEVADVSGQPLQVSHEAGILTVGYEDLTWDGLRGWLRPQRHFANLTVMVAKDCPVQLGVVNATTVVAGLSARATLKGVSGDMTLDGVTGQVEANTVSGGLEARGVAGEVAFHSVSGDLTLAGGSVERLETKTVSGRITADMALAPAGQIRVGTLSGDVALRLPAGTGAKAELRSASGQLHSDFDALMAARVPGSKTLAGTLGDGSGKLSVNTMSGDVTILQRSPQSAHDEKDTGETAATRAGGTTVEGDDA
jgi:DUF4097 and DUF4098 domain-containing protein YvlB